VASWLSVKSGKPCISFVSDLSIDGDKVAASSQLYGGKMQAEVAADSDLTIVTVLAGSFPADAGQGSTSAEKIPPPAALDGLKVTFKQLIKPEGGDIDITSVDKLISV
ncbi:MAG: electron transfer flavoprotein subunit alpha/FixB family protein, partial [Chloroflexota bacterium]